MVPVFEDPMVAPVSEVLGLLAAGGCCLGSVWNHARLGVGVADSPIRSGGAMNSRSWSSCCHSICRQRICRSTAAPFGSRGAKDQKLICFEPAVALVCSHLHFCQHTCRASMYGNDSSRWKHLNQEALPDALMMREQFLRKSAK